MLISHKSEDPLHSRVIIEYVTENFLIDSKLIGHKYKLLYVGLFSP